MEIIENDNLKNIDIEDNSVLYFSATWCGPCQTLSPTMGEISEEKNNVIIAKIDVDKNPGLTKEYQIKSIPTLLFLKGGQTVDKIAGVKPKNFILEKIDSI